MRNLLAALTASIAFLAAPPSKAAISWGTDLSDLWVTAGEAGWGANVAHQGEVLFVTLFIYGADARMRWYSATLFSKGGTAEFTFEGDLYETTGPYFGSPVFNPATVTYRKVGTATLTSTGISRATLKYDVDNVPVTKSIERSLFRYNNLAGSYIGATNGTASGCTSGNGKFEDWATFTVTHSATNAVSIAATFSGGGTCTHAGTYSQSGRMGEIAGTTSCSNGARATFSAYEIEASHYGLSLRYTADYGNGCAEAGRFTGLLRE